MRVDVSGQRFVFPSECACCGATPDSALTISASRSRGSKVVHTETKSWDVPYCTDCIEHLRASQAAGSFARLFTFLSVLLGVLIGFGVNPYLGAAIGILAVVGTVMVYGKKRDQARAECDANCVNVDAAIAYLGWYGTLHKFEIGSQQFACDFMTANQNKLVNLSSEARSLLSASGSQGSRSRSPHRYVS
jgi:hypothetical protein